MKTVAISGYFDPIHIGHINYIKEAKKLGEKLIVIVNNDKQAKLKKGHSFMPETERVEIIKAIKYVDEAVLSIDNDRSVCKTLEKIKPDIFANGGDRTRENIPETTVCKKYNISMIFNVGGKKVQSSSDLIKNAEKK